MPTTHTIPKLLGHALAMVRKARAITGDRIGRPPEAQACMYAAGYSAKAAGRIAGQVAAKAAALSWLDNVRQIRP